MQRRFGTIVVEWDSDAPHPYRVDGDATFTQYIRDEPARYMLNGGVIWTTEKGTRFDSSSIPWLFRFFGLTPECVGPYAADLHDDVCIHPEKIAREIGDALYFELARNHPNASWRNVLACVLGIRLYSWYRRFLHWKQMATSK